MSTVPTSPTPDLLTPAGAALAGRRSPTLISVCTVLLGWGARPVVLADASLPHVIDDPHTLQRLIDLGLVSLISDRPIADLELLERAERDRAPVLSHDGFDDHLQRYPWAWSCGVDCRVRDGVVELEAPKLEVLLEMHAPPEGALGDARWSRMRPNHRHRDGVRLARAWLHAPPTPPEPEPPDPIELQFPNRGSLGWLYRRVGADMWRQYVWKLARDTVRVQRGEWLGLQVRGRGVCDLAGLKRLPPDGLSEIWWTKTALVDDHQLQNLAHLTGMKELGLYGQLVTDKGIQLLEGLVGLETLDIASVRWDSMGTVTRRSPNPPGDRSAFAVSQLWNLRYLGAGGWNLTLPGVAVLSRLRNLETLDLSDTPISDLDIAALATLPRLTRLFVRNTPLTDTAVDALVHFPSLGLLDVTGTQMTSAWQRALPSVKSAGTLRPGDTLSVLPRLDAIRIAAGAVPFR